MKLYFCTLQQTFPILTEVVHRKNVQNPYNIVCACAYTVYTVQRQLSEPFLASSKNLSVAKSLDNLESIFDVWLAMPTSHELQCISQTY